MTDPLLSRLGVPDRYTAAEFARIIGVDPAQLSPSRLPGSGLARALAYAADLLRGEDPGSGYDADPGGRARAGQIVEALDGGALYSVGELQARLRLWGMDAADDWLVRLHGAGAAVVFAAGGWCAVRRWARGVVS